MDHEAPAGEGRILVFLQEALTQVEDGRGPQPYEDRRFAPARGVERKRDQDREERPSDVDSLATVHAIYLLYGLLDALYPADDFGNRERTAALLSRRPNFLEFRQGEVRRIILPRTRVNKGIKKGRSYCAP